MEKTQEAIRKLNYVIWFIGVISIAVVLRKYFVQVQVIKDAVLIISISYILYNINKLETK
ncbi:MAG: hypothetical protein Q4A29_03905 [Eubacteriales bacterium]|nr:hypothetical protein [Eubacteriales bacterium]